mgnify:CR=1 FL=1
MTLGAILALLSLLPLPSWAGSVTPEMDKHVMAGIDAIYEMRFDEAEASARKVIALAPEHPYGYFGLAAVGMTRYVYQTDQTDQSLYKPFEAAIEQSIASCNKWLKKHPGDADVLFVLGASYGVSGRIMAVRHDWIKAYLRGRKAMHFTREALKADPKNYDSYLGIGMYDYYTDVYPRVVGVLAKLVLRGSRERGIKELKIAAEKGHFAQIAAKLILVEIYTEDAFGARDPEQALMYARQVRAKYPDSAMLHAAELIPMYVGKQYEAVAAGAEEYMKRVAKGEYPALDAAKGWVIKGTALWALGQKEKALEAIRAGTDIRLGKQLCRWSVWALIRCGQLQDLLGKRDEALKDYKKAAAEVDYWDLKRLAKAGIAKPWTSEFPGPVPAY